MTGRRLALVAVAFAVIVAAMIWTSLREDSHAVKAARPEPERRQLQRPVLVLPPDADGSGDANGDAARGRPLVDVQRVLSADGSRTIEGRRQAQGAAGQLPAGAAEAQGVVGRQRPVNGVTYALVKWSRHETHPCSFRYWSGVEWIQIDMTDGQLSGEKSIPVMLDRRDPKTSRPWLAHPGAVDRIEVKLPN